jgi:integrase
LYVDERKNKDGTVTYRFTYTDPEGKRRRFPQSKVTPEALTSRQAAEEWAASQAAIHDARKAEIARKLSWRSQYHDFEELLARYGKWQAKNAPNSWKSSVYYLEQWVFPFFLGERKAANVNDWHLQFQQFRDWLLLPDALQKRGRRDPLAVSTQNNIIKALNTFLKCLRAYHLIDPASVLECPAYPEHMLATRDASAVILEPERDKIMAQLAKTYPPAADFFFVLWHTGMRFNELFSLPITALFKGEIRHEKLRARLDLLKIQYHGYIYLESQAVNDDRKREPDHSLRRKPLKGCKTISPKNSRVIPIRSKEVWNVLALRYKAGLEMCATGKYGSDRKEYVFFEDAEWNKTVNSLREAYQHFKLEPKGYHSCRHTFVTMLVGETGDEMLTRMITGHKTAKSFERYQHLYEQIALAAQQQEQDIDVI